MVLYKVYHSDIGIAFIQIMINVCFVYLQDPNSNKIKQLRGEHDASGVITRFILMDTQPVIGDW